MRIPNFLKKEKTDAAWEFRVPDRQHTASRLEAALDEKEPLEPTKEVTVGGGAGGGEESEWSGKSDRQPASPSEGRGKREEGKKISAGFGWVGTCVWSIPSLVAALHIVFAYKVSHKH
jgi:hypothetical protein